MRLRPFELICILLNLYRSGQTLNLKGIRTPYLNKRDVEQPEKSFLERIDVPESISSSITEFDETPVLFFKENPPQSGKAVAGGEVRENPINVEDLPQVIVQYAQNKLEEASPYYYSRALKQVI